MQSSEPQHWQDAKHENERYLTKVEAARRAQIISDVSYKLSFALVSEKDTFNGC
jgi:hypothetical protein